MVISWIVYPEKFNILGNISGNETFLEISVNYKLLSTRIINRIKGVL
jgi:hypothetical protein